MLLGTGSLVSLPLAFEGAPNRESPPWDEPCFWPSHWQWALAMPLAPRTPMRALARPSRLRNTHPIGSRAP